MSRFFTARSSGSEDESSDDAEVIVQKPAATVASRFVKQKCPYWYQWYHYCYVDVVCTVGRQFRL